MANVLRLPSGNDTIVEDTLASPKGKKIKEHRFDLSFAVEAEAAASISLCRVFSKKKKKPFLWFHLIRFSLAAKRPAAPQPPDCSFINAAIFSASRDDRDLLIKPILMT